MEICCDEVRPVMEGLRSVRVEEERVDSVERGGLIVNNWRRYLALIMTIVSGPLAYNNIISVVYSSL